MENGEGDADHGDSADVNDAWAERGADFARQVSDDESDDDDTMEIGYNDYDDCYIDLITMIFCSTEDSALPERRQER